MKVLFWAMLILIATEVRAERQIPKPLEDHPGNIFLKGEEIHLAPLPAEAQRWKLVDYEGATVAQGNVTADRIRLGPLPVGYYELYPEKGSRVTLAVISPLAAPTPQDSPISTDVAMAWFYKDPPRQRAVANLCQLAGMNWVRDRLAWPAMEATPSEFAPPNIYDDTARIQSEAGLKVLQVNHIAPPWQTNPKRFPTDLRDAYRFYKQMAARWKGKVLAFEPWNEADIDAFGGHTGSEMASLQKAAYLGLKAGNSNVIACQNVFAIARQATLDDFAANESSAYFDTCNLHHYVGFDKYAQTYAAHRAVSGGKPMWVTECNVPVQWADEKTKEPTDEHLRWQANRVAKVYAMSLHEGSANTFYFILGHYVERKTQYGIIKEDLTPRPAFVALAAVGRLLAGAKPLGRIKWPGCSAYLFDSAPDGKRSEVLVAWSAKPQAAQTLPRVATFDHLGRELSNEGPLKLTAAPTFAVFPPHSMSRSMSESPPARAPAPINKEKPADVVLQALMRPETVDLARSAYILAPDKEHTLTLRVYEFGNATSDDELLANAPSEWKLDLPAKTPVQAGGMTELKVKLAKRLSSTQPATINFRRGAALLSIRIVDQQLPQQH